MESAMLSYTRIYTVYIKKLMLVISQLNTVICVQMLIMKIIRQKNILGIVCPLTI